MTNRFMFYKVELNFSNGATSNILIASRQKARIPELIEHSRSTLELFASQYKTPLTDRSEGSLLKQRSNISGFRVTEDIPTIQMSIYEYESILATCDIVDDIDDIVTERATNNTPEVDESIVKQISDIMDDYEN